MIAGINPMQTALHAPKHPPHVRVPQLRQKETPDELLLLAVRQFQTADDNDRLSARQLEEAYFLLREHIGYGTLQIVARDLAECVFAPRAVIMALALEKIGISEPVLKKSRVLGQLDILRIAQMQGIEHCTAIAHRADIGPSAVTFLREKGNQRIDMILDANIAVSGGATRNLDQIFEEIDLRHEAAKVVPEDVKGALDFKREAGSAKSSDNAMDALLSAAARGGRLSHEDEKVQHASQQAVNIGSSFEQMAASKSRQSMAVLMQKASAISLDTAFTVLEDDSGDTLSVFLRAHDVEPAVANRILMLTFPEIGLSVRNAMRAVKFYATLTRQGCVQAIAKWPKASAHARHQPVLHDSSSDRGNSSSDRADRISQDDVALREAV